jgi:hypothetical protein
MAAIPRPNHLQQNCQNAKTAKSCKAVQFTAKVYNELHNFSRGCKNMQIYAKVPHGVSPSAIPKPEA